MSTDARALLWEAKERWLETTAWLDYVREVYAVDPGGYPFLTYIGLNFTEGSIKNFKLYFSFFKALSSSEVERLLPVPDRGRFDEMYAKWHPTRRYSTLHRGTTFALKVGADGALTHYYHLRVPGAPLGLPERLALAETDVDNYHGVCEEFSGGSAHLKRYYYCKDPRTIADSLVQAGFPDYVDQVPYIDWLEYIESEGRDKADWVTTSPDLIAALVEDRGPPRLDSALAKICLDCGFELFAPGSAVGGADHAIYFVQPEGHARGGGYLFDGARRFIERYLGLEV